MVDLKAGDIISCMSNSNRELFLKVERERYGFNKLGTCFYFGEGNGWMGIPL